jgi:nucleoside-diphosphate-sugar epimerase
MAQPSIERYETKCCLLSGASGYVGNVLKRSLIGAGWRVVELTRRPNPSSDAINFRLGASIAPDKLEGFNALIHCAYDFSKVKWSDIQATNVRGSERLLRSAQEAGVHRLVYLSTISAFEGCQSLYGRGKLAVENVAQDMGASIIRPGLVYGPKPGAAFGRLVENVCRSKILPIPGQGEQRTYLVHEQDLADAVLSSLVPHKKPCSVPVTVAHEQSWSLRSILLEIASALDRKIIFVPTPWQMMWAGLRLAEALKIRTGASSDSLISLVHQNPNPIINAEELLGIDCRPFDGAILRGLSATDQSGLHRT